MASDNYMFRRIMVAIIRLCSHKGKLNTVASNIWFDSEIIPTRCNNCVYSSQWLYSTCFG